MSRKLYPNVDFYSGLVYRAMGFPPQFFTVLFAIPRWVVHMRGGGGGERQSVGGGLGTVGVRLGPRLLLNPS